MISFIKNIIRKEIISNRSSFDKNIITKKIINNNELKYFIKNFGNKNKDKIFYVIQRLDGGGMFSNLNFVIHHLKISQKLGCIPIIDMQNFPTKYNETNIINKQQNAWNYYFEPINKYKLSDIYKSKFVIISENKTNGQKEFDTFKNLGQEHYKIYKKKIKFKPYLVKKTNLFIKKHFKNQKVLGVHFRGTDMKTQERHPFPATTNQIVNLINYEIRKNNYNKIFLVTEENKYLKFLKKIYKDKLCFANSFRTNKSNIFEQNIRRNHRFKIGQENIIDMLILSQTNKIICTNSHLPDACKFINKKIKLIEINNGNNSKNIFIAQFLWYIKKILPKFLGGFDKLTKV
jgi:hypothetical protein